MRALAPDPAYRLVRRDVQAPQRVQRAAERRVLDVQRIRGGVRSHRAVEDFVRDRKTAEVGDIDDAVADETRQQLLRGGARADIRARAVVGRSPALPQACAAITSGIHRVQPLCVHDVELQNLPTNRRKRDETPEIHVERHGHVVFHDDEHLYAVGDRLLERGEMRRETRELERRRLVTPAQREARQVLRRSCGHAAMRDAGAIELLVHPGCAFGRRIGIDPVVQKLARDACRPRAGAREIGEPVVERAEHEGVRSVRTQSYWKRSR